MCEVLATVSNRPLAEVERTIADFAAVKGSPPGDRVMSEAEYRETRQALRAEMFGIKRWLMEGAIEAREHPGEIAEFRRQAAQRN